MFNSDQSCKNVPTSWCYFFWPVLIFGKSTQKTGKTRENRRKTGAFLVLMFLGGKLVGANFYAFCNYGLTFALCLGFIIPRRKKSQLPTCVGSYHLVSRQILFCGIFSNCMREKTVLVIYKIANYHVYIFWGSICLHNRCTITE